MGKKQHQKDKLYLTTTEWKTLYGGKKDSIEKSQFRRLPFDCCSLSMQPFEHPLSTESGVIFDLMNIVPFLKRYGLNPVNGEKLSAKDLIKLNFHKNASDQYHCPVTFRIFNENTHIVAIKTTGNVFSYEAVERLNLKPKFLKDLLTDEPFTRKDIITIQDPSNLDKFNLANFYHLKKNLKLNEDEIKESKKKLKNINLETKDILAQLEKDYKPPTEVKEKKRKKADAISSAHYSSGRVAASFTSTAITPETQHQAAIVDEDILRYERVKKKSYIKLFTNLGTLNLELHSDQVPKTCENFLKLCQKGFYNDTIFHRSIRNFMIQGGDPTATGLGGESIWGDSFKDEFKSNLTHTGRDNKHTVFGRVVGGLDTLDKMEKIKADKKDKPVEEIQLLSTQVFVDPYTEADEQLVLERETALAEEKRLKLEQQQKHQITTKSDTKKQKIFKQGIGKYINPASLKRVVIDEEQETEKKYKKIKPGKFGDFSNW
ncbi:RING-type E3 ubiquitin-protein ligase PPIL2-like isoform X2 [Tubulanus polymorphus]|uniref:RING-type E3 ubiquitin-protein ligase PPIL2-like isoform X2 n=1 Tax=Tubulanus polymorphus TaxID=672921 RepID=UPI003DA33031